MNKITSKNIFYSDEVPVTEFADVLEKEDIKLTKTDKLEPKMFDRSFSVLLINTRFFKNNLSQLKDIYKNNDERFLFTVLISDGKTEKITDINLIDDIIQMPLIDTIFYKKIKRYFSELYTNYESAILKNELEIRTNELAELAHIGSMLMMEKDLDKLLDQILFISREITSADAGSLYLVEENEKKEKYLRFKLSQTDSLNISYEEFTMPITKTSIAGCVAFNGETLNIEDAYEIPADKEYKLNKSFDEKFGYRTKSMLVIPLKSHTDEVIGVIQLINRKKNIEKILKTPEDFKNEIIQFDEGSETLLYSLGGQAAVAIENSLLYQSIENLFEGFVKASVTAIESRDPTTSGHSQRVAVLTVGIAEQVDKLKTGEYEDVSISKDQIKEIRYASLLHDFGKVGVRENVLVKEKKLYPYEFQELLDRFKFIKQNIKIENLNKKLDFLQKNGGNDYTDFFKQTDNEYGLEIKEIDEYLNTVVKCNEPSVLEEDNLEVLKKIKEKLFMFNGSGEINALTDNEFRDLSIKKGSLNEKQRLEIESHVTHTFKFLQQVPWTKELKGIPGIAYAHHEKLDGVGYPQKLTSEQIPIQSKMMTIADIFDALTAADRPYKKAVPYQRALDILNMEMKSNHIDKDLLDLFINTKTYEKVINDM
ncbi:MAG TPA: GAF domain-containing protein [bacterium]|nr:GAF domain-containing protein [bacterium]